MVLLVFGKRNESRMSSPNDRLQTRQSTSHWIGLVPMGNGLSTAHVLATARGLAKRSDNTEMRCC